MLSPGGVTTGRRCGAGGAGIRDLVVHRSMWTHPDSGGRAAGLINRQSERAVLDQFVAGVRAGEGRALVVRGEPGVGKTVLLDYLAGRAAGCRVARIAGVQSEMELPFAGLHQLCAPMLEHAELLPGIAPL
jgi:AAA ATPase domain